MLAALMFRTVVHVTMPFCACGDDAKLVTGVLHTENSTVYNFVECTQCSHQMKSRVGGTAVTIIRENCAKVVQHGQQKE